MDRELNFILTSAIEHHCLEQGNLIFEPSNTQEFR